MDDKRNEGPRALSVKLSKVRPATVWLFAAFFFYSLWTHFNIRSIEVIAGPYADAVSVSTIVSTAFNGVALILCAIFHRKIERVLFASGTLALSVLCSALGTLIILLGNGLGAEAAFSSALSGVLSGVGSTLVFAMLATLMVKADSSPAIVVVAYLAATMMGAAMHYIPALLLEIIVLLIPLFSVACASQVRGCLKQDDEAVRRVMEGEDFARLMPLVAKLGVFVFFVYWVNSVGKYTYRDLGAVSSPAVLALAALIIGTITIVSCYSSEKRFNMVSLYRIVFLIALASFASFPLFAGAHDISYSITAVLTAMVRGMLFISEFYICLRTGASPLIVFGIGEALKKVPVLLAYGFRTSGLQELALSSPEAFSAFLSLASIVLVVIYVLVFTEKDMRLLTEIDRTLSAVEQLERHRFTVADKYGLTDREREVFLLLCNGRSAPHIAKSLYISTSTVNMHVRKIYQKMEIHSKQELLDLVALPSVRSEQ